MSAPFYRLYTDPNLEVKIYGLSHLHTLPERSERYFHAALMATVPGAVDSVLRNAQRQLTPGHGYDSDRPTSHTGKHLRESLIAEVISTALNVGVLYTLRGDDDHAYWFFKEFGFTHKNGTFVEGLHFFSKAINANRGRLGKAAAAAWRVASARLAAESRAQAAMMPKL
jgi:hypothetical protein